MMRDPVTLLRMVRQLALRKWRQSPFGPRLSMDEELASRGLTFEQWWAARRNDRRQFVELVAAAIDELQSAYPDLVSRTLASADRALRHEFDLLGSGLYRPVDGARPVRSNGYVPIDWAYDPVRKVSFPNTVPYKEWKLFEMRPKDADVKFPWELARCQQFAPLGQAFRLTGESRYALEIVDQIEDFVEANPVGIGVNWTCTMDVALRAANWALALALIKDCPDIPAARFHHAYAELFKHGRFIFANFENTYEVTSNHYLSNVVGLHILAAEFPDLVSGREWDDYCRGSLEQEIDIQILPDGADFESSIPYHRLVTELFLGSYVLSCHQRRPLSAHYAERLRDMVDYLVGVMRPDGLMPQVGDADDGRFVIFTDWAGWQPQDARHLLGPASHALDQPDWLRIGGDTARWEAAWWGYPNSEGAGSAAIAPPDAVELYPYAGHFVARSAGDYLLVTNSKVGTKGFGNHKHNDQLGFELHFGGAPLIVDPGSFVYTSDFDARNRFRSTAAHSTLSIDDVEQNEFNPEWLFRMIEKADAEHVRHEGADRRALYVGRHVGYRRLEHPVTHERAFHFDMKAGLLEIEDALDGTGVHHLRWTFQFAPGVAPELEGDGVILWFDDGAQRAHLRWFQPLAASIEEGAYSPSYGVSLSAPQLRLATRVDLAVAKEFRFTVQHLNGADHQERHA